MTLRKAEDLSMDELNTLRDFLAADGKEVLDKSDLVSALETLPGFPRWQHGKQYAKTQAGKTLDRMRRAGMVRKDVGAWVLHREDIAA